MVRFDKLDNLLNHLECSINTSVATTSAIISGVSQGTTGRGAINKSHIMNEHTLRPSEVVRTDNMNCDVNNPGAYTSNWAASHVASVESSSCGEFSDINNEVSWQDVRRRKRRRVPSQIQNDGVINDHPRKKLGHAAIASASTVTITTDQGQPGSGSGSYADKARYGGGNQSRPIVAKKQPIIIGKKVVSSPDKFHAAKPYIGKAVYCIDNVFTDATEDDMRLFVTNNGITVLSCHAVMPRRSRYQRLAGIVPTDRNSFRLCIPREQKDQLLNPDLWPAKISISSWIFTKKQITDNTGSAGVHIQSSDQSSPVVHGSGGDGITVLGNDCSSCPVHQCAALRRTLLLRLVRLRVIWMQQ
jgi:hypothetical protein